MDWIHKTLNFVFPLFTFFFLCFFLPPFYLYKFFLSILSSFISENVAGKVVLITGASSGIGEHLAYEYGRRGALLALAARREKQLQEVADRAREFGSPDVITIRADVSKVEDCERMVEETMSHFGKLNHLVNNAGIISVCMFEEATDITNFRCIMDTNFWGSVYTTRSAARHLRESNGKIIVLSSAASWLPAPRMSFYNASKAAMLSLFETLRVEFGPHIHITIVTPGFIESEMTKGKFMLREGKMAVDQELRDAQVSTIPVGSVNRCAKAIVNSACRRERYLTEPAWFRVTYLWKVFCPELVEWTYRLFYIPRPGDSPLSKKILDLTGAKKFLYPDTIRKSELKAE